MSTAGFTRVQLSHGKAFTTHADGSTSTSKIGDSADFQIEAPPAPASERVRVGGFEGAYRFQAGDAEVTRPAGGQMINRAQSGGSDAFYSNAPDIASSARDPIHGTPAMDINKPGTLITVKGQTMSLAVAIRAGLVQRDASGKYHDSQVTIEPVARVAVDSAAA